MQGIAYLGLLLALGALVYAGLWQAQQGQAAAQRLAEDELLAIGLEFRHALRSYQQASVKDSSEQAPKTLSDLLRDPRQAAVARHLRKIYTDPMTGKPQWGLLRDTQGGIVGIYSLSPQLALKKTGFHEDFFYLQNKTLVSDWQFVWGMPCDNQRCYYPAGMRHDVYAP